MRNPTPLGNREVKLTDKYSEELMKLIESNKRSIFKSIREVVYIDLSKQNIYRLPVNGEPGNRIISEPLGFSYGVWRSLYRAVKEEYSAEKPPLLCNENIAWTTSH